VDVREVLRRVARAEREARRILATHEASVDRIITIEQTYDRVGKLSISQGDLLKQALRAIEHGLYRSAIVMAWAAFMDFAEEKLGEDGFVTLNAKYVKWKIANVEDLREKIPDFQIVTALKAVKLSTKTGEKTLQGLLGQRNESAHPSEFLPDINESLGFVSNVLQRIERMKPRKPT
jgi:hypothetical protein